MTIKKLSFFDLDKTLLKGSSSFQFGSYLYKHRHISFFTMLYLVCCYGLYKLKLFSIPTMQKKIFKKFFSGKSQQQIEMLAENFVNENFHRLLNMPAVSCLILAQQQNHFTAILSSSPSFLVQRFAERFKVDSWEATHYSVENGCFNGIANILLGKDKAAYVDQVKRLYQLDKEQVTAYSDSYHDIDFLESAGSAIAVSPDRQLRKICQKNNWPIL